MRSVTLFRNLSTALDRCGVGFLAGSQALVNRRCNYLHTSNLCCQQSEFPPNSSIVPESVNNRNPRNLEKIRIADKPSGWNLERESKSYWNKVTLDLSSKHVTGSIVHYLGQVPITASTKEWCLKKYLYNTNDAVASKLVGEVLARRCLQAGITEIACFFPEEERKKEKVSLFLEGLENGGVALTEAPQVPYDYDLHRPETLETPWDVHEDVDDKFSVAQKLRGWTMRTQRAPKKIEIKTKKGGNKKFVW